MQICRLNESCPVADAAMKGEAPRTM